MPSKQHYYSNIFEIDLTKPFSTVFFACTNFLNRCISSFFISLSFSLNSYGRKLISLLIFPD